MKKLCLRLSAFICVLFTLASPALAQGNINFTAEVDRTAISSDDQLTLTLTVSGDYQQASQPQLPMLSGFNVVSSSQSSQFSMINGVTSMRVIFTYRLQPTGPGAFTIDPITIQIDGSTYQTDPITVQVTQGAAPTQTPAAPAAGQTPAAPAPNELAGQDVYVKADVDDPAPFVGQQIVYRFRFYQAVNLSTQPQLNWPTFSGFWTQDLTPNNVYEQIAAERRYRVTEVRRALFATAAGQVVIEPSTLIIPGGLFSRDVTLNTAPVVVNVQPLPEGAPEDSSGVVGQFDILAWVEPAETRVNEPLTLFVRVSGVGNVTAVPDPTEGVESALSDWRVYDPQTTTNVSQDGDAIRGDKLFARLLLPRTEGELTIPSFALAYFDPQAGEYRRVETGPLVIPVAPGESIGPGPLPLGDGKQDVTLLAGDIRHGCRSAHAGRRRQGGNGRRGGVGARSAGAGGDALGPGHHDLRGGRAGGRAVREAGPRGRRRHPGGRQRRAAGGRQVQLPRAHHQPREQER